MGCVPEVGSEGEEPGRMDDLFPEHFQGVKFAEQLHPAQFPLDILFWR